MKRRTFLKLCGAVGLSGITPPTIYNQESQIFLGVEGNSLSAPGALWFSNLTARKSIVNQGYKAFDFAVSGSTINQMVARESKVDAYQNQFFEKYLIVWEYTNTMQLGVDVLTTYLSHRHYCLGRKAAGFKILIGTGLPRYQALAQPGVPTNFTYAQMQEINEMTRKGWTDFADGIMDFGRIPELNREDSPWDTKYFRDGVHLTPLGETLIEECALKELQRQRPTLMLPIIGR